MCDPVIIPETATILYFKNKKPKTITSRLLNDYPTQYRTQHFSSNGTMIEEIYYNTSIYQPLARHRKWTTTGQLVRDVDYDSERRFHGRYQTYAADGRLKCNCVYNHGVRVAEREWQNDFADLQVLFACGAAMAAKELAEMRREVADGPEHIPTL
jgi:hypothetical protein